MKKDSPKPDPQPPICPHCSELSRLTSGQEIYPHRKDLAGLHFYICTPCGAYVGCHEGTKKPLGILANSTLRMEKSKTHHLFDPLWNKKEMTRSQAYEWLARELNIPKEECHIGHFTVARCIEAQEAILRRRRFLEGERLSNYAVVYDFWGYQKKSGNGMLYLMFLENVKKNEIPSIIAEAHSTATVQEIIPCPSEYMIASVIGDYRRRIFQFQKREIYKGRWEFVQFQLPV